MIEDDIKNILFKIGQEIKLHKIDDSNMIIEIDYEKYLKEIFQIIEKYR